MFKIAHMSQTWVYLQSTGNLPVTTPLKTLLAFPSNSLPVAPQAQVRPHL